MSEHFRDALSLVWVTGVRDEITNDARQYVLGDYNGDQRTSWDRSYDKIVMMVIIVFRKADFAHKFLSQNLCFARSHYRD